MSHFKPYDEEFDLIYKDHVFDVASQQPQRLNLLDFKKTFHPEFSFAGIQDIANLPIKLFIWSTDKDQRVGFSNGELCGPLRDRFKCSINDAPGHSTFTNNHPHVFSIVEKNFSDIHNPRTLLFIRYGSDSEIQILSDYDSIKYEVRIYEGALIFRGFCDPSFPN